MATRPDAAENAVARCWFEEFRGNGEAMIGRQMAEPGSDPPHMAKLALAGICVMGDSPYLARPGGAEGPRLA